MAAVDAPETHYVTVGNADVAYQVLGDGETDLLYCYGLGSHLEMFWEVPESAEYLRRLASFSRLIFFDRRGTGASDGIDRNAIPTWEEWTEDMLAVLESVGSTRAAILATLDSGPIAIMFAAMHPERVSSLVLVNTSARYPFAEDYPIRAAPEAVEGMVAFLRETWGSIDMARMTNPSLPPDSDLVNNWRESYGAPRRRAPPPRNSVSSFAVMRARLCRSFRRQHSCSTRGRTSSSRSSTAASWPTISRRRVSSNWTAETSASHRRRTR